MVNSQIYQFYAELNDFKPKIWRRFQVSNTITAAQFGYIIQVLFEMTASHLFSVEHERPFLTPSGKPSKRMELLCRYDIIDPENNWMDDPVEDAAKVTLDKIDIQSSSRLTVWYDFGDDWRVSAVLEKVLEGKDFFDGKEDKHLPLVLEGKGLGIVEDVGGVWGLTDLVEIFKDKKSKEYKEISDWLGQEDLNINAFDLEDMNFRLQKIPAIYQQLYENRQEPTDAEIDLIEREYLKKDNT